MPERTTRDPIDPLPIQLGDAAARVSVVCNRGVGQHHADTCYEKLGGYTRVCGRNVCDRSWLAFDVCLVPAKQRRCNRPTASQNQGYRFLADREQRSCRCPVGRRGDVGFKSAAASCHVPVAT